jgi:hypothetical protein
VASDQPAPSAARGSAAIAESLGFEPDNHHNALACPYCTGNGWWITTGRKQDHGKRILGPFVSRDLALNVRTYVERAHRTDKYWVVTGDEVPDA